MSLNQILNLKKTIGFISLICLASFFSVLNVCAQDIEAKIKVKNLTAAQSQVHIEGRILKPQSTADQSLSFLQNYADVSGLGGRIENLNLYDENGLKIGFKQFAPGEFKAEKPFVSFAYDVKTEAPKIPTSAAHISWLTENQGLLMLNDLLPQLNNGKTVSAQITLEIPADWKIASGENQNEKSSFDVRNIERAIFYVGKKWREKNVQVDKTNLSFVISGEWQFSDDDALQMASSILEEYRKIFGEIPVPKAQVFLLPFPQAKSNQSERWRAETRGSTVTLVSGVLPLKSQALQRLHEQLRHEIFHLWIPNALNLTGNYDWFFEGFTVYESLKTGVQVNQIRFQDYLNTLANAYDMAQNQNASLVEISSKRWTSANNSVYPKGMIAAFLCDAAILRESKGKRSIENVFRQIYQKYKNPNPPQDASTAILGVLKSYPELRTIAQNYIEGSQKIEWSENLSDFGIKSVKGDRGTELKVLDDLKGRQKDLLDKLGYNQWRKLAERMK